MKGLKIIVEILQGRNNNKVPVSISSIAAWSPSGPIVSVGAIEATSGSAPGKAGGGGGGGNTYII